MRSHLPIHVDKNFHSLSVICVLISCQNIYKLANFIDFMFLDFCVKNNEKLL